MTADNLHGRSQVLAEVPDHGLADLGVLRQLRTHLPEVGVHLLELAELPREDLQLKPPAVLTVGRVGAERDTEACHAGTWHRRWRRDWPRRSAVWWAAVVKVGLRGAPVERRDGAYHGRQEHSSSVGA